MEETSYLEIKGMHCAACAVRIEKAVSKMEGVIEVSVSLTTEKGRFTFHKDRTNITEIINKIKSIGFMANEFIHNNPQADKIKRKELRNLQGNLSLLHYLLSQWRGRCLHIIRLFYDRLLRLSCGISFSSREIFMKQSKKLLQY